MIKVVSLFVFACCLAPICGVLFTRGGLGGFFCRSVGYRFNNGRCGDINECEAKPYPCKRNERCINTQGSFKCLPAATEPPRNPCQPNPCRSGYTCRPRGSSHVCDDVNECTGNPCSTNSVCRNTPGSFNCQCNTGYGGPQCTDIDECRRNPCKRNERCVNNAGSFRCVRKQSCRTGYSGTPCRDINECVVNSNICRRQRCVNTAGSYRCVPRTTCQPGYAGSPCQDINECSSNPCPSTHRCVNTAGSYNCVRNGNSPSKCKGQDRKWGKCSTTYPETRTTVDSCKPITENCPTGTALAQQLMDNLLAPPQAKAAQSVLGARVGFKPKKRLTFGNVIRAPPRCTLMTERDEQGNIRKAACVVPKSKSPSTRGKRMAAPILQQTKRDLLIMLDESGSIDIDNFEKVKDIAAAIVELLCDQIGVNPAKTRIAITTFDRNITMPVRLMEGNSRDTNAEILAHFIRNNIHFRHTTAHRTCLVSALEHAYTTALDHTNGGRRGNPRVEQDIIMISDGCENCIRPRRRIPEVINHVTNFFIQEGIHVYVIGININRGCQETLALLAQGGRCFHFFYLDRWDYEVDDFIHQLKNPPGDICLNIFESPLGECLDPISNQ